MLESRFCVGGMPYYEKNSKRGKASTVLTFPDFVNIFGKYGFLDFDVTAFFCDVTIVGCMCIVWI